MSGRMSAPLKSDLVFDGATVFHPVLHAAASGPACDGAGGVERVTREAFWEAARTRGIAKEADEAAVDRVFRDVAVGTPLDVMLARLRGHLAVRASYVEWLHRDRARGHRGGPVPRATLEPPPAHFFAEQGAGAADAPSGYHPLQPSLG